MMPLTPQLKHKAFLFLAFWLKGMHSLAAPKSCGKNIILIKVAEGSKERTWICACEIGRFESWLWRPF
jgi:hypothetical protein